MTPAGTLPPEERTRVKRVRVTPRFPAVNIAIYGNRDPRGPDNNVRVWLGEDDTLHIRVQKAERCYKFRELVDCPGFIEIIQE